MTPSPAPDPSAAERDAVARFDAAPALPESHEGVGRLAQVLHDVGCGCGDKAAAESSYWRPIAFVATTTLGGALWLTADTDTGGQAAIRRVLELADELDVSFAGSNIPGRIRAAVAGPTAAEEGQ